MDVIDFVKTDCEDYSCHHGVTFQVVLVTYQDCLSVPNDLTGYTANLLVFDGVETSVIVSVPGVISTPLSGEIMFTISATDTATLPIGVFSQHVQITSTDNTVYRLSEGTFEINI